MDSQIYQYKIPSKDKMDKRLQILQSLWQDFINLEDEPNLVYHIHLHNIFEVIKRQDQRMHYYKVFHSLDYPCEYKYVAILCFWINTLKPFMVTDDQSRFYDCPNEKFSLYLILSTIREIFNLYHPKEKFSYPSKERIEDILYDFKYCSFSREAMISFVETFADTYGVGIQFILKDKDCIKKLSSLNNKKGVLEFFK